MVRENEFEVIDGEWWIPKHEATKAHGILKKERGYISLEIKEPPISGKFLSNFESNEERILGISTYGKDITALNCRRITQPQKSYDGYVLSRFIVESYLSGAALEKEKEEFDRVDISLPHLVEWFDIFRYEESADNGEITIKYKLPDDVTISINNSLSLSIRIIVPPCSNSLVSDGPSIGSIEISPSVYLTLSSKEKKCVKDWLYYVSILQEFFTFCTERSSFATNISFPSKTANLLQEITYVSLKYAKVEQIDAPFWSDLTYTRVQEDLGTLLKKWFSSYEQMRQIITLYNSYFTNVEKTPEQLFLDILFALEGFNRRTSNNSYLSQDEYEKIQNILCKAIPGEMPSDLKDALKSRLKYGNEHSLRTQIKNILSELPDDFKQKIITIDDSFVNEVVSTRNYLVHTNKDKDMLVASGEKLIDITSSSHYILKFLLWTYYGIPKEKTIDLILNSLYNPLLPFTY